MSENVKGGIVSSLFWLKSLSKCIKLQNYSFINKVVYIHILWENIKRRIVSMSHIFGEKHSKP